MILRVVTLNLLHGAPLPGMRRARRSLRTRLDWTSEHLARERPDVVLLQEASATRHHGHVADELARRLGLEVAWAPANPAWLFRALGPRRLAGRLAFEEGPAVLSRLPIVAQRVHLLSSRLHPFERRIALEAVLDGPPGPFSVFSVHVTAGSARERQRQIARLVRAVETRPHAHPVIVGGDFNAEERSHEMRHLTEVAGWIDSFRHLHAEAAGHTWGHGLADAAARGGRRIDFLFSVPAGGEHWRPSHSRLVLDRALPRNDHGVLWASDHYGVLTEFQAPPPRGRHG